MPQRIIVINKKFKVVLLIFSLTISLIYGATASSTAACNNNVTTGYPRQEIRGVWLTNIDSEVLFSPKATEEAIDKLAELKFNTIYPTVWNWGYTLYPSSVAAGVTGINIDPHPSLGQRDVLQEIITRAKKKDLTVIPWFEFGFMAPWESSLAQRHPQWLTQRQDGSTIWLEGGVHKRVWLNPLHPQVQEFITNLIVELVSNYDVDGVQLDDHFGYPSDFGYDSYTVKLYQAEHDGRLPPEDPKDPEWIQWRADKITQYVQDLFGKIKAANPNAIVSVSPNPQQFSLEEYLLDWQRWEQLGLIEELVLQLYRDNMVRFRWEIGHPEVQAAKQHIPTAIGILTGLKGRPVHSNLIQQQIETVRNEGFAGVSFFFYESLWNLTAESTSSRQAFWRSLFDRRLKPVSLPDCSALG